MELFVIEAGEVWSGIVWNQHYVERGLGVGNWFDWKHSVAAVIVCVDKQYVPLSRVGRDTLEQNDVDPFLHPLIDELLVAGTGEGICQYQSNFGTAPELPAGVKDADL